MAGLVDFSQSSLWAATGMILFNPLFWNTAARVEHKSHLLTKLAGGNPYYGCYGLAVTIFSIGIFRDHLYNLALQSQPTHPALLGFVPEALAVGLFVTGSTFVVTSMWALGVTGTYLGDYFGILMDDIVTGFPFSVINSPMYWGSTMSFLGTALWYGKPAGILLTGFVYVVYKIALAFEDPFTAEIYAKRDRERQNGAVPKEGRIQPQGGRTMPKGGFTEPKGGYTKPKGL